MVRRITISFEKFKENFIDEAEMPRPDHFKRLEELSTCADCIHRSTNKDTMEPWCSRNGFPIPRPFKSKLKSMYRFTCDDIEV